MTREEALNILHNASVYHPDYLDALNMAIKALEQEPCEDCISRQAVIDILDDMTKDYAKSNDFEKVNGVAWVKVQKLPSVNPQKLKTDVLDKLDEIITDALDKSTDQKESQTLRWVLDKISEVT